jgi:hypothetical protein
MIAEPLVYISKLEPVDVGICPVSSRNGTREYYDEIVFALRIQKGSPPKSVCWCPFSIIQAKKKVLVLNLQDMCICTLVLLQLQ